MRVTLLALSILVLLAGATRVITDSRRAAESPSSEPTTEQPVDAAVDTPVETDVAPPRPRRPPDLSLPLVPPETSDPPPTPEPVSTPAPPPPRPPEIERPPPEALGPDDFGVAVQDLQLRLVDLGYWMPVIDGDYGPSTAQSVMAFQKVEGLEPDGVAGPDTLAALPEATRPTPMHPDTAGVEIDLARQVMFIVYDGAVAATLNTSTGRAGWRTRPGTFAINRQINGYRHAPLGTLYRPKYFNGGIAMHGSGSIPNYPASHGCARLSNAAIDMIWESQLAPIGTTVTVY